MSKRKVFDGIVIGDKMQKTIVVRIMHRVKNPKYGRIVKSYTKFKAHDEKREARVGDTVRIEETRPLSKDKHFMLAKVLKKSPSQVEMKE